MGLGVDTFASQRRGKLLRWAAEAFQIQFEQKQKVGMLRVWWYPLQRDAIHVGQVAGKPGASLPAALNELREPFELRKRDGALHLRHLVVRRQEERIANALFALVALVD